VSLVKNSHVIKDAKENEENQQKQNINHNTTSHPNTKYIWSWMLFVTKSYEILDPSQTSSSFTFKTVQHRWILHACLSRLATPLNNIEWFWMTLNGFEQSLIAIKHSYIKAALSLREGSLSVLFARSARRMGRGKVPWNSREEHAKWAARRLSCIKQCWMMLNPFDRDLNSLSPGIKMHILLTVLHTFLLELLRRICLNIKTCDPWWSLPLLSSLECLNKK